MNLLENVHILRTVATDRFVARCIKPRMLAEEAVNSVKLKQLFIFFRNMFSPPGYLWSSVLSPHLMSDKAHCRSFPTRVLRLRRNKGMLRLQQALGRSQFPSSFDSYLVS